MCLRVRSQAHYEGATLRVKSQAEYLSLPSSRACSGIHCFETEKVGLCPARTAYVPASTFAGSLRGKAKTQDKRCSHHRALRYTEVKLEEEIMAFDFLRGPLCSPW